MISERAFLFYSLQYLTYVRMSDCLRWEREGPVVASSENIEESNFITTTFLMIFIRYF